MLLPCCCCCVCLLCACSGPGCPRCKLGILDTGVSVSGASEAEQATFTRLTLTGQHNLLLQRTTLLLAHRRSILNGVLLWCLCSYSLRWQTKLR